MYIILLTLMHNTFSCLFLHIVIQRRILNAFVLLSFCVLRIGKLKAWRKNDTNRFLSFFSAESKTCDTIFGCSFFLVELYVNVHSLFSDKNTMTKCKLVAKREQIKALAPTNKAMNFNFIWFHNMSMDCCYINIVHFVWKFLEKIAYSIRISIYRFEVNQIQPIWVAGTHTYSSFRVPLSTLVEMSLISVVVEIQKILN